MPAITLCQRAYESFHKVMDTPHAMLPVIRSFSITKAYEYPIHILWIIPALPLANLAISIVAAVATVVLIVALPVFLVLATCQLCLGDHQAKNFWLAAAVDVPRDALMSVLVAMGAWIGNTCETLETLSRGLESLPPLDHDLARLRTCFA